MKKMMQAIQAQTTPLVRGWLNVMTLVLVGGGAVFSFSHTLALLVLLSALASLAAAVALFGKFQNIYVLGATHIPLWGPLAIYIIFVEIPGAANFSDPYTIWLTAAAMVMVTSLIFDVRDLYLVFTTDRGRQRMENV